MTSVKILSQKGEDLIVRLDEPLNIERIKTMYGNDLSNVLGELNIDDPRRFSSRQRNLFFALLKDISKSNGTKPSELKDHFYQIYEDTFDQETSLKKISTNTMSQVNDLIEMVIEFIFENNMSIESAFSLLPKTEGYYLYICCKYRKCIVCGRHADMHHVDALGIGSDRTKAKHLKHHFMALCRTHHQEIEQIGRPAFAAIYHVPVDGIKLNEATLKLLNIQGDYTND